jgi:7-carboxy-7-deazaguanine synthase
MTYSIKEIFYTLQGEGRHAGRSAVFCRFSGCNLWSGKEKDRLTAICRFCDTDFVGMDGTLGGKYLTASNLADAIEDCWPVDEPSRRKRMVVFTGGEPLLQLDSALIDEMHRREFFVAIETNGTKPSPPGVDWICVSPKVGAPLVLNHGNELKLVFPQNECDPSVFADMNFQHFYLQPMDGPNRDENVRQALEYCLANPQWQLSLQIHKLVGLR